MSAKADRLKVNAEIAKGKAAAAKCVLPCKKPTPVQALDVRVRDAFKGNVPVKDAEVEITTAGGGAVIAKGKTDRDGDIIFRLPVGNYKVWARKDWHIDDPVAKDTVTLNEYDFPAVNLILEELRYYLHVDADRDGDVDNNHEGLNVVTTWKWEHGKRGAIALCNNDHDDALPAATRKPDNDNNRIAAGNDGTQEIAPLEIRRVGTTAPPPAAKNWKATLEVLDGKQDRIRLFPALASGTVQVLGKGAAATHVINLRQGASSYPTTTFGMEATTYSEPGFDGLIRLKLTVSCDNAPSYFTAAEIRVAPWMMPNHLDDVRRVYVVDLGPDVMMGTRITRGNSTFRAALSASVGAAPVIVHPNQDRWMQDCMEVGFSVLPRNAAGNTRQRIEAVMQAYRDFGTGDLKKFPGSLLDADFGTHFPGSASVSTTYNSAKVGAPGGSKARIEAIRAMLVTIIRKRLEPPPVPRFVAALSAAEANDARTVLVADPDDLPTALSKLPASLAAAVKDAADAVETELVAAGSIDAGRPSMFSSARTAILAKGAPVSGLADDLADAAVKNVNFLVNRTTTYDSNGNLECTPPCKSKAGKEYPWGRIYYGPGAGAERFDSATKAFLQAQIVQKPFPADTNWLLVGHVDEMVSFVPAPGPKYKNWCFQIASPRRAFQLLDSVPDATVVMDGRQLKQGGWASVMTTAGVLRNGTTPTPVKNAGGVAMTGKQLRKFNLDKIQKKIDKVRETFEKEAGVEASRTIDVPVIFKPGDAGLAEALTADMVNMLVVNNTCVIPRAFGPVHPGPASDLFYDDLVTQLNAKAPGLALKPVDDWYTYHAVMGEIHCGTNVNRHPSSLSAWLGSEAAEWWRFRK